MNNDKHNVMLVLNLLTPASADLLNATDVNDLTPIMYCLKLAHNDIAAIILSHPVAKVNNDFIVLIT